VPLPQYRRLYYGVDAQGQPKPVFNTRRTRKGALVVEIDVEADPDKQDPRWLASIQRRLSRAEFLREYRRDWSVAKGRSFYPEYVLARHMYEHSITKTMGHIMDQPVYRGWDFGYQNPACVWAQYSQKQDRIWFIRELSPTDIDTHNFTHLVKYLSGQIELTTLQKWPKACAWLEWILKEHEKDPEKMPKPPWFDKGTHFIDYAGDEANKRSATVEGENAARTDNAVLASYGVQLQVYQDSWETREGKMRKLMTVRTDGLPGMFIDPACDILRRGFSGGIAYPEPTKSEPQPKKPRKDGYFEHTHEASTYVVCNVVPKTMDIDGGPAPNQDREIEVMDLKETRDSVW
jgi:hypothetical protein